MADAGHYNTARNDIVQLRGFQELFKGRFTDEEAVFLLEKFNNDSKEAAFFVLSAEPTEVRKLIEEEKSSWTTVTKPDKKTRQALVGKVESIRTSSVILIGVKSGRIDTSVRQYACGPCDSIWWRRSPERKEVSKCNRCRVRYDPVPKLKEWGWALFKCPNCTKEFGGFNGMWQSSPCYGCGQSVSPYCIQPPVKDRQRRTNSCHRCNAPDCSCNQPSNITQGVQGRRQGQNRRVYRDPFVVGGSIYYDGDLKNTDPGSEADYELSNVEIELPMTCVHPMSRQHQGLPKVIIPSRVHDSTGSTVDTFLPQDDLSKFHDPFYPMETIDEMDND